MSPVKVFHRTCSREHDCVPVTGLLSGVFDHVSIRRPWLPRQFPSEFYSPTVDGRPPYHTFTGIWRVTSYPWVSSIYHESKIIFTKIFIRYNISWILTCPPSLPLPSHPNGEFRHVAPFMIHASRQQQLLRVRMRIGEFWHVWHFQHHQAHHIRHRRRCGSRFRCHMQCQRPSHLPFPPHHQPPSVRLLSRCDVRHAPCSHPRTHVYPHGIHYGRDVGRYRIMSAAGGTHTSPARLRSSCWSSPTTTCAGDVHGCTPWDSQDWFEGGIFGNNAEAGAVWAYQCGRER